MTEKYVEYRTRKYSLDNPTAFRFAVIRWVQQVGNRELTTRKLVAVYEDEKIASYIATTLNMYAKDEVIG